MLSCCYANTVEGPACQLTSTSVQKAQFATYPLRHIPSAQPSGHPRKAHPSHKHRCQHFPHAIYPCCCSNTLESAAPQLTLTSVQKLCFLLMHRASAQPSASMMRQGHICQRYPIVIYACQMLLLRPHPGRRCMPAHLKPRPLDSRVH